MARKQGFPAWRRFARRFELTPVECAKVLGALAVLVAGPTPIGPVVLAGLWVAGSFTKSPKKWRRAYLGGALTAGVALATAAVIAVTGGTAAAAVAPVLAMVLRLAQQVGVGGELAELAALVDLEEVVQLVEDLDVAGLQRAAQSAGEGGA